MGVALGMPLQDRKDETRRIKETVDMLELVRRYISLNHLHQGPCPACGGNDRFYVHKRGNFWACRKCTPGGGDCFDFLKIAVGMDFKEASEYLTGKKWEEMTPKSPAPTARKESDHTWRDDQWQLAARKELAARADDWELFDIGPVWMANHRGITEETCLKFGVGYHQMRGAISLPYRLPDGRLTGIKYRKTNPLSKADRFTMYKGSEPIVFGGHLLTGKDMILLIEGEMNCMAVAQVYGHKIDVVSFGTESRAGALTPLVEAYRRHAVWVDSPKVAERVPRLPGKKPQILTSPDDLDANDLLLEGILPDVLDRVLRII